MEINNIEVITTTYGKAYLLDNVAYDIHFPLNWALYPEKTHEGFICGPSYCQYCFKYGTYKGVFIGYCIICAAVYNYERGNGFINCGEEIAKERKFTIAPLNKSNYVCITDMAMLKQLNPKRTT